MFNMSFKNKLIIVAAIVTLLLTIFILPLILKLIQGQDDFTNASGYGLNNKFGEKTCIIPLNIVPKATDFKLFSLVSQLKYSFIKPPSVKYITGTDDGIIEKPNNINKNVILFSGCCDLKLKQDSMEVWPNNISHLSNKKPANVYNNNSGHFNTITTLLETIGYKDKENMNTILYDFREFDLNKILEQFKRYLKPNTVIIAYDFGAVIANLCILALENKEYISKFILISPTLGGTPITIRDYFSGNGIISPNMIENYYSILMSLPNENMLYDKPVVIYNSLSYNANSISELLKEENKPVDLFKELMMLQNLSLKNSGVPCIFVTNNEQQTPICYNYKNNLKGKPEMYKPLNNNKLPTTDIHNNGMYEGLQSLGDGIVPFENIQKIIQEWNKSQNNCYLEIIKDKDHFTILKSYELALVIVSNL